MRHSTILLLIACLLTSGCRELQTKYGETSDVAGYESIAGFGVMRKYFQNRGWRDRGVRRLSERYDSYDAIVWTNRTNDAPSPSASTWFDEWLQQGDRTLIYVIRDFETVDAYWQRAAQLAEPTQRLEYRRRKARSRMEKLKALQSRPDPITNSWFTANALNPPQAPGQLRGPWAKDVVALPNELEQEYSLRAFDSSKDPDINPQPVFNGFNSILLEDYEPPSTNFESLLLSENGETLVSELTTESWGTSRVIVVAGGSYLTNYGLTDSRCRDLLVQLEDACRAATVTEDPKVGFLATDSGSAAISSLDPSQMGPTGLEMLTEYPINLVTVHGLVCGLIVVLSIFPILGRPRWLESRSQHDFDAHIDAVAALMSKTLGEQYARVRISEYMVRVRGEESGEWVLPVLSDTSDSSPAQNTKGVALASGELSAVGQIGTALPPAKLGGEAGPDPPDSPERPSEAS